jgi:8-oxo-dGTP pyrophosphatase MutT (NUDIX family)
MDPGRVPAPRILQPQAIPVAGVDDHLVPVLPERLTAAALRERFARQIPFEPEHAGDGRLLVDRPPAAASVLVPLVQRDDGLRVLLTRRTDHLRDHAGQISFPGGRAESQDADAAATALRETVEEVGLAPGSVEIIGALPTYTTVTHYVVTPVVGLVSLPFELKLDSFEVAEAFEVPLSFLMTPANHRRHVFQYEGGEREFLSMPWGDYFIWGATAAMLRNLYRFLSL